MELIKSITLDKYVLNNPSEITDYHTIQKRAKRGISYLIRLCGFSNITKSDIKYEQEMMKEFYLLLREINAQEKIAFKLTLPILTEEDDYNMTRDTAIVHPSPVVADNQPTKDCSSFQNLLREKISTKDYDDARKKMSKINDGDVEMKSK